MLAFINSELMSINGETENRKNGGSPYFKISCDGSSMVTPRDPSRPCNPRPILRMACNATVEPQQIDEMKGVEFIDLPTTYSARDNGKGISILVRELDESNKRDIYVVAFPFHGVLKPLPKTDAYDVLKGMIVVSGAYSIPYNNYTYKNILYLVISPKDNSSQQSIRLESYCLKSNKKKGVSVTMHEVMDINLDTQPSFSIWDEETEPVDMNAYKNLPVWELAPIPPVEQRPRRNNRPFPTREEDDAPRGGYQKRHQRRDYPETHRQDGSAIPSGGFAKNVPVHHRAAPQEPIVVQEPLSTSLDSMIENALNNHDKYPAKKKPRR